MMWSTKYPTRLTRWLADVFLNRLWCKSCCRWRPMSINGWRCDGCTAVAAIDAVVADIYFRQSLNMLRQAMMLASDYYIKRQQRLNDLKIVKMKMEMEDASGLRLL